MVRSARWRWFGAGAVLGAAAGAAFVSCASVESTDAAAPDSAAERVKPAALAPRAPAPRANSTVGGVSATARENVLDVEPLAPVSSADDVGEEFPGAAVEITAFDGAPVADAEVYALPAGRPGNDAVSTPPHATTDAAGRARLRVPWSGRYDVGALHGVLRAMARDVDFPRDAPLRLTLPEPVEVAVVVPPDLGLDSPGQWQFCVGEPSEVAYPGRDDPLSWTETGRLDTSTERLTFTVPRGARCRFSSPFDDYLVRPSEVVAPGEFRLSADPRVPVTLRFAFDPQGEPFPHACQLRIHVAAGEGDNASRRTFTLRFGAGTRPDANPIRVQFPLPADGASIRWNGDGVLPGATDHVTPSPGSSPAEVVLQVSLASSVPRAPGSADPANPAVVRRRIRVDGAGDGLVRRWLVSEDGDVDAGVSDDGTFGGRGACVALASCGDRVATLADVAPESAGDVVLALRRGGYLVVVPQRATPADLGSLVLARDDGKPFLHSVDGRTECVVGAALAPGLVLGPLPEGPSKFVVRIAGEVVATASATVRAGAYEPLTIPRLGRH